MGWECHILINIFRVQKSQLEQGSIWGKRGEDIKVKMLCIGLT